MNEKIAEFLNELSTSISKSKFVKMSLGQYRGSEDGLQKMIFRLIETKKGLRLNFQYRYTTRDIVKNHDLESGQKLIAEMLGQQFFSGHLFTVDGDTQLEIGKRGARLNRAKPTFKAKPVLAHDRKKNSLVDQNAYYLKALGITNDHGEIRTNQFDKWKQIVKFVEIIDNLYSQSKLAGRDALTIMDMGSGSGYLTFAVYDHFRKMLGADAKLTVVGIEAREDLVNKCSNIAAAGEFEGLSFKTGTIDLADTDGVDILIALHACDTATDDALFKGITSNAEVIVAAPCCHKELRRQIKAPGVLKDILKHGTMMERTAETITDGLRAMILEEHGYRAKVFEFVPTEHTPKNNMITALNNQPNLNSNDINFGSARELANYFSIKKQRLFDLLKP